LRTLGDPAATSLAPAEAHGATQIVTGCGKRALYVELLNNSRCPTWLLNSNVDPVGIPANAQSAR
jgi:hypothetical protein